MNKIDVKKIFQKRKNLYLILALSIVSVYSLTIAYAALNAVLTISGNAEISGSSWSFSILKFTREEIENLGDENAVVDENFLLFGDADLISSGTIYSNGVSGIDVSLSKPGDGFAGAYKVVNTGSIPAKIQDVSLRDASYNSLVNSASDVEWARNNIRYYYEINDEGLIDNVICPGDSVDVAIFLLINEESTTIPSDAVEISNIGLNLSFAQADTNKCN